MTEPDDDSSPEPDDLDPLESLKEGADASDNTRVEDANGARTRWNWNPVTDAGGTPRVEPEPANDRSGFHFDLGGALSRLDDDPSGVADEPQPDASVAVEPDVEPTPVVEPEPIFEPTPVVEPAAVVEPTPVVEPAAVVEPTPAREPGRLPTFEYTPVIESAPAAEVPPASDLTGTAPRYDRAAPEPATGLGEQPLPRRRRSEPPVGAEPSTISPQIPEFEATATPEPQLAVEQPLPTRTSGRGSVFDAAAAAPILPPRPETMPVLPTTSASLTDPGTLADRIRPPEPAINGALPTLPAANPLAPPPLAAPIEAAPSTPDLNALRSAQLRANRQQQRGKMLGRSLLAFIVIASLMAAALIYGRSYLFQTEWDAPLTPIVDKIQEATGVEFDHTVPLVVQPPDEHAAALLESRLGSEWVSDVPGWRALGLVNGDITAPEVAAKLSARQAAFYDPVTDTIYQAEDKPTEDIGPSLQAALLAAFQHQMQAPVESVAATDAFGLIGIPSQQSLARRSVDSYLIQRTANEVFSSTAPAATESDLPLPIAYELAAADRLGESILAAAGVDPAVVALGDSYPDAFEELIDDSPVNAAAALLQAGDQPIADSIALGNEDWSLVWRNRLPSSSVNRLARIVTADSYRPINRDGAICFVAVFQTATEADATALLGTMALWAQRGAAGSQALATQIAPTRVQLEACDPGVGTAIVTDPAAADGVIDQQIERLAG